MERKNKKFIRYEIRNEIGSDPFNGVLLVSKIYDYEVDNGFWEVGTDIVEKVEYKRNGEEYFTILKKLATKYGVAL